MPKKEEVLETVDRKKSYTGTEVRELVHSVKSATTDNPPTKVKIGDVYIAQCGAKKRPVIVISVREKENLVIAIPSTTTEDEYALSPYTSRFFGEGWFSNQLLTCKLGFVRKNFVGVLDNKKAILEAKKELRKFYKNIL